MRNKILALILLSTLLAAPLAHVCAYGEESGVGGYTNTEADSENLVTEDVFRSIKMAAEELRDEAFSRMDEDLPTAALGKINEAFNLMIIAEESEATDLNAATQLYMQAMRLYREAWTHMDEEVLPPGEASGSDEPVPGLEQDENLNEEILMAKQQLLVRFRQNFKERLDALQGHIQYLSEGLDPEDSAKAENALEKAEEKLEAQDDTTVADLDDALDELDTASKELKGELKSLKDKEAAELIVTVDKLEGEVQKLNEDKSKDVGEEPEATDESETSEEPEATDEPKGNSGASEDDDESKDNGDSSKNYKSKEDYIRELKERIQKSLEDFRDKRYLGQASNDDRDDESNDEQQHQKKVKDRSNNRNRSKHTHDNEDSNSNDNTKDKEDNTEAEPETETEVEDETEDEAENTEDETEVETETESEAETEVEDETEDEAEDEDDKTKEDKEDKDEDEDG